MPSRPIGYFQLLRQNPNFTRLWIGQLVSYMGDWFNTVAVLALVFDLTHSGLATGLILIASTLPAFVLAPFAGAVVDRFDRRRVMIAADLIQALLALGMLFVRAPEQIWLLYLFSALLISSATFFGPALNAAIPNLVTSEELLAANALSSGAWGMMLAVGAAVGGVVIAAVGRNAAFVFNSFSFVFSALMILSVRKPFSQAGVVHRRADSSTWQDFLASLEFVRSHPQVTASLMVKTGWGLAAGVLLLLTIFSQSVFQAGAAGIGWLYSARGLGALLGPYFAQPFVGNDLSRMRRAIFISFLVAGFGYLGFSRAPIFAIAALCVTLAHTGGGLQWTLSSTMLQILVPDRLRGRIFAIDFGMNTVTNGLSTFLVGLALERWDARDVATSMSLVFLFYALLWGAMVFISRRRDPRAWDGLAEPSRPGVDAVVGK